MLFSNWNWLLELVILLTDQSVSESVIMTKGNAPRRGEDRPEGIVDAAFAEFAEKGYSETRLQDVAARAGVSKGLPYLYFKTKEELFKAVLRRVVKPFLDRLFRSVESRDEPLASFLRGSFLSFAQSFVASRRARVLRLLIAEGPKHPDLTQFYAEEVIRPALASLRTLIDRAQQRGEIGNADIARFPQLIIAPVMLSALWNQLFARHLELDVNAMLAMHVENVLLAMEVRPQTDLEASI